MEEKRDKQKRKREGVRSKGGGRERERGGGREV